MRSSSLSSNLTSSEAVTTASFLHEDLVFAEILTRLPPKSLMRFKCVSKTWNTRISGDYFIYAHERKRQQRGAEPLALVLYNASEVSERESGRGKLVRVLSDNFSKATEVDVSYLDAEIGEIVGTCDGLACVVYKGFPNRVLLWNPATHQRRWLPSPDVPERDTIWTAGFGLDTASGEYKVVLLSCVFGQTSLRTHVFAKGGTVWRGGSDSGIKGLPLMFWTKQVAAEGALHWKFKRGVYGDLGRGVLSFDLSSETLRCADGPSRRYFEICGWKSSLAAIYWGRSEYNLKTASLSPGGGLQWSSVFTFTLPVRVVRLRYVWREQFVLVVRNRQDTMLKLVDPKDQRYWMKLLGEHGPLHPKSVPILCDYVETIVSVF